MVFVRLCLWEGLVVGVCGRGLCMWLVVGVCGRGVNLGQLMSVRS